MRSCFLVRPTDISRFAPEEAGIEEQKEFGTEVFLNWTANKSGL